jgi:hypothetical protein
MLNYQRVWRFTGDLPSGYGDFSWFNNGLTMVKNGMIMGYTQPGYD